MLLSTPGNNWTAMQPERVRNQWSILTFDCSAFQPPVGRNSELPPILSHRLSSQSTKKMAVAEIRHKQKHPRSSEREHAVNQTTSPRLGVSSKGAQIQAAFRPFLPRPPPLATANTIMHVLGAASSSGKQLEGNQVRTQWPILTLSKIPHSFVFLQRLPPQWAVTSADVRDLRPGGEREGRHRHRGPMYSRAPPPVLRSMPIYHPLQTRKRRFSIIPPENTRFLGPAPFFLRRTQAPMFEK